MLKRADEELKKKSTTANGEKNEKNTLIQMGEEKNAKKVIKKETIHNTYYM